MLEDIFEGMARGIFGAAADRFNGASCNGHGRDRGRIERYCRELGWSVDEREGNMIKLHFKDEMIGIRKVVIHGGDNAFVGFVVVSHAILPKENVPPEVAGYLLLRNAQITFGKWQLMITDEDEAVFVLQYDALGQGLSAPVMQHICKNMIPEVAEFDRRMQRAGLLRL